MSARAKFAVAPLSHRANRTLLLAAARLERHSDTQKLGTNWAEKVTSAVSAFDDYTLKGVDKGFDGLVKLVVEKHSKALAQNALPVTDLRKFGAVLRLTGMDLVVKSASFAPQAYDGAPGVQLNTTMIYNQISGGVRSVPHNHPLKDGLAFESVFGKQAGAVLEEILASFKAGT